MRPEILNPLFAEAEALKGVGPGIAKSLARLDLTRAIDLAYHLPTGTIDRVRAPAASSALLGRIVVLDVTPVDVRAGAGKAPLRIYARDGDDNTLTLTFFNNPAWAKKQLPLHEPRTIVGKLDSWGSEWQIVHPEVLEPGKVGDVPLREPVYGLTEGISNKRMRELALTALERAPELPEWIEPSQLARDHWPAWRAALAETHSDPGATNAHKRLAYDEIFANQLALLLLRQVARRKKGLPLQGDGRLSNKLQLPYRLTGAQQRVIGEIRGDMAQDKPMLRLLQGDVGSGKTLVALLSMLEAVEAGAQAAMLAPTEILARQHFATLQRQCEAIGVRIAILTGREKGRARESVLMGLADGSIDILVGTHAIFQQHVAYQKLGLIVIDEQHRFGVSQRLLLSEKAERPPHLLAMTATPIPRTLTLTHYGEMDVSRIDEMPPGRTPVETLVISDAKLGEMVDGLARHISNEGQAFWVCPLVEESEAIDAAAAEDRAAILRQRFGDNRVGLVHGRMKGPEKDAVMTSFASGELAVLVATTVIEVGVDVPNATLMIVEGAERFGLAQLHQLRGRVGRGAGASRCILLRGQNLSETGRARLALMRETNDGFRIAEEDLRLRGPGEILGTRQSGEQNFRVASPEDVAELAPIAQGDARLLLDRDGGLASERGQAARLCLYLFERDAAVGLLRSG
ncbi:ATP-dependent DNA helicase RecG [Sphingomonas sp. NSE70-1]|uniref:Probable DNA 3'-5' helicase RecG n=1 Tax=Sphingomonas caseinilyticus TaxID=2908205 RepID=A0ABT0RRQ5_9SPHN|nr:ATP-dependent DNA helicase RecG [Sphingomonas caseinilyticus]MCL6697604.1 ATP-dependent DNA helicase RecG [Sphingomonas caseinilyticus]